jgi:hypothetical protein
VAASMTMGRHRANGPPPAPEGLAPMRFAGYLRLTSAGPSVPDREEQ